MAANSKKLIVVAGGTGNVGQHIVDDIIATKKHNVKVFNRHDSSASSNLTTKEVQLVKVDYSDHASLVIALQGAHTVIVCLSGKDSGCTQVQLNLLNACLEAKVQRFAPSEWGGNNGANTVIQSYREHKLPVLEKVKSSGIEYTVFMNGLFMDYFAAPQKASPFLPAFPIGVDFNKCEANIVGTGDEPFCVTQAEDVGRIVAAALDLDKWDERSGMVGSRTTWNELIKLGEQVRGKEFNVKRVTIDEALSGHDPDPAKQSINLIQQIFVAMCRGEVNFEETLNKKFPEIRPTTVEEFVAK